MYNQIEAVEVLVSKGADVNVQNAKGETPLHLVSELKGNADRLLYLLMKNNASLNAKDNSGRTPLMCAIESRNYKIFESILKAG